MAAVERGCEERREEVAREVSLSPRRLGTDGGERVEGEHRQWRAVAGTEEDDRDAFAGNPLPFSFSFYSSPFSILFSVF